MPAAWMILKPAAGSRTRTRISIEAGKFLIQDIRGEEAL
jgi:hypothetical protein